MSSEYKRYLGDAVYADYDGYHIVLTTEDGISETNRICLEPSVMRALGDYGGELTELLRAQKEAQKQGPGNGGS